MQPTLPSLIKTLRTALDASGKIISRSLSQRGRYDYKDPVQLVTATDIKTEKKIIQIIHKTFPDHAILAEESKPSGKSLYKWIIDPVDGTTNFAHTFPFCCTSIAVEYKGKIILGGIYDPFHKELFFAAKGKGATLNSKKIHVSAVPSINESLLVTGFPYDRKKHANDYLQLLGKFMIRCHGIRRTGSAALDICYVACGRFDGFWEPKLMPWDTAAATLIASEAGGKVSRFDGSPYSVYGPEALVSNRKIHPDMLRILAPYLKTASWKRILKEAAATSY